MRARRYADAPGGGPPGAPGQEPRPGLLLSEAEEAGREAPGGDRRADGDGGGPASDAGAGEAAERRGGCAQGGRDGAEGHPGEDQRGGHREAAGGDRRGAADAEGDQLEGLLRVRGRGAGAEDGARGTGAGDRGRGEPRHAGGPGDASRGGGALGSPHRAGGGGGRQRRRKRRSRSGWRFRPEGPSPRRLLGARSAAGGPGGSLGTHGWKPKTGPVLHGGCERIQFLPTNILRDNARAPPRPSANGARASRGPPTRPPAPPASRAYAAPRAGAALA